MCVRKLYGSVLNLEHKLESVAGNRNKFKIKEESNCWFVEEVKNFYSLNKSYKILCINVSNSNHKCYIKSSLAISSISYEQITP